MHAASEEFDQAPVCQSGDNIVYAWAMDAPELRLPAGVGFKVGDDTDIQWLVLQVHYKDVSSFLPPSESLVRRPVDTRTNSDGRTNFFGRQCRLQGSI